MPTVAITEISEPQPTDEPYIPAGGEKWIEVNLSEQTLYAWEDDQIIASFLVSTGLPGYETPVGTFKVWVKLLYDDMTGVGYDLDDVPYVMYFYYGYGIHGTYWHHNFGTPMSHGCVNMETSEAEWLFNWAYVGIQVEVHY